MKHRLACIGEKHDWAHLKFRETVSRDEGKKKFGKAMRSYGLFQTGHPRIALSGTDLPMAPAELIWRAGAQIGGHFRFGKSSEATRVERFHEAVYQGVIGHLAIIAGGSAGGPEESRGEVLVETPWVSMVRDRASGSFDSPSLLRRSGSLTMTQGERLYRGYIFVLCGK
jgi:hypothetical protein